MAAFDHALLHAEQANVCVWSTVIMTATMLGVGLLALAMRSLPLGTAYTIWSGTGAVNVFASLLVPGEQAKVTRLAGCVTAPRGWASKAYAALQNAVCVSWTPWADPLQSGAKGGDKLRHEPF